PFPGESITTVIYKIVNEQPVPPRTIDPTIHPGISAAVLRALAKEPEDRYQSCHEFLEDLRNYRNVAAEGNPRATVPSLANRNAQPNATVAMNPGLRGMAAENPQMTPSRGVAETFADPFAASANPTQTPLLRRTDHIPPYEPPEEKSIVWTVLAALVLVGVIGFGAYKLKPVLYDVRHPETRNEAIANAATQSSNSAALPASNGVDNSTQQPDANTTTAQTSQPSTQSETQPSSTAEKSDSQSAQQNAAPNASDAATAPTNSATQPTQTAASEKVTLEKTPTAVSAVEKTEVAPVKKPVVAKAEPVLSAKAAQVKQKIEDALAERNLSGKASVQGVGNTLTITGKLRPGQHAALLNLLHDLPAGVKVVDNISDGDLAPAPSANSGNSAANPNSLGVRTDRPGAAASAGGAAVTTQAVSAKDTDNSETPKPTGARVAWADVKSFPVGAEIFVDEKSTGQSTPARVQVSSGVHVFTLHLEGFRDVRRGVDVSDGGTVEVRGLLRRNKPQ
ncbi:MAG TPA: PEGA domain-containing protein, partial [Candidatus Eremiobacteraceae bacterium]|nr:PEGA domain-containing protein [Candidatus Eremiobacteraceae bacterium]